MALVTKKYLTEQVQALLGAADAGAKFPPRMILSFLQQAINSKLKMEYFAVTLPGDETIPEGILLASYDSIPVEKYKGTCRAKLPVMPISLRRGMGIYFVGPAVTNANIDNPVLTATVISSTSVNLSWIIVPHATNYFVQRATNAAFTINLTGIYSDSALAFLDTGLTTATTYYYKITASASAYTDGVSIVTATTT